MTTGVDTRHSRYLIATTTDCETLYIGPALFRLDPDDIYILAWGVGVARASRDYTLVTDH